MPIIKKYQLLGGSPLYNSYSELISTINTARAHDYSTCLQKTPPYSCTKYTITSMKPMDNPTKIINGEYTPATLPRDSLNTSQASVNSPIQSSYRPPDIGPLGAYIILQCPKGYYARGQLISTNNYFYDCIRYWDYYLQQSEPTQSDNCEKEGNPCNPITGNKTQTETDFRFEGAYPFVFQRVYSSLGVGTAASSSLGVKWRHSFERSLVYSTSYPSMKTSSGGYSSADEACSKGWVSLKEGMLASDALARKIDDKTCEIYKAGQVLTRFNIIKKLANEPISTTAISPITNLTLSRPDGSHYIFRNESGSLVSFVKGISLVSTSLNTYTFTDPTGTKEFYEDSRLIRIEAVGGLVQTLDYQLTTVQGGDDNNATLDRVSDHLGRSVYFKYDANGQLMTLKTAMGDITYEYQTLATAQKLLNRVIYPNNTNRQYHYGDTAKPTFLTGITDEAGKRFATWSYEYYGKVSLSTHANNKDKTTFSYPDPGVGTTNVGKYLNGSTTASRSYKYKLIAGMLKTVEVSGTPCLTCTDGEKRTREYDDNGFLSAYTDWRGTRTELVNNSRGYPEMIKHAVGTPQAYQTMITWHAQYALPLTVEAQGLRTTNSYDAAGRILTETKTDIATQESRTSTWTYNSQGLVDTFDGPRTDVSDLTQYSYDAQGNLTQVSNALNQNVQLSVYDLAGRPTQIQDPNGLVTNLSYDWLGNMTSMTQNGQLTQFEYNPVGLLTKVILPSGVTINHAYDAGNSLIKTTDSQGNTIHYEYDWQGNLRFKKIKNAADQLTYQVEQNHFGPGWLREVIGNAYARKHSTWRDEMGNITIDYKPGNTSTQAFDALNRLTQVKDALQGLTVYTYDANGNIQNIKAPNGAITSYTYNGFGDKLQQISPDTGTSTYTYDSSGNIKTETDARGITVTYAYDVLNRLLSQTTSNGEVLSYTYDTGMHGIGHLTQNADTTGSTQYTYDIQGQRLSETRQQQGLSYGFQYAYNTVGQLDTLIYPSGQQLRYSYDANGQVKKLELLTNGQTRTVIDNVTYLPFGSVQAWTWGNGKSYFSTYDLDYRLTTQTTTGLTPRSYVLDSADQVTKVTTSSAKDYSYDALGRLRTEKLLTGVTSVYQYDANGNRKLQQFNTPYGTTTDTYSYVLVSNILQNLTGSAANSFSYDAVGNLTQDNQLSYAYDGFGHLQAATNANTSTQYAYNAQHQRVQKAVNGTTTYFYYDDAGRLLAELDSQGQVVSEYIYLGYTPLARVDNQPSNPPIAANSSALELSHPLYYLHTDQIAAINAITDVNQQVVWQSEHDAFGKTTPTVQLLNQPLRFPGQYADAETGLYYNWHRYYNPLIGRYISSDPIGLAGGLNTFGYVGQSPLGYYDPNGLAGVGHHYMPRQVWRDLDLPPEVKDIFDKTTSGQYVWSNSEFSHKFDDAHRRYSQAVKDLFSNFLNENNITPNQCTTNQALEFLEQIDNSDDWRIKDFKEEVDGMSNTKMSNKIASNRSKFGAWLSGLPLLGAFFSAAEPSPDKACANGTAAAVGVANELCYP